MLAVVDTARIGGSGEIVPDAECEIVLDESDVVSTGTGVAFNCNVGDGLHATLSLVAVLGALCCCFFDCRCLRTMLT